ncbi:MAG: hypothetical protein ACNI25_10195 [Halarcobacter sp.]
MAKITLDIDEKNISTVMNILKNLKVGLIKNITQEQIKPISSSISNVNNKKYISKETYKKRLNQDVLEDEFLPKSTSSKRYLTPNEFKNKLNRK